MEQTPITADFPLRPLGEGETLVQVFRSAADQGEADERQATPSPESSRRRRDRRAEPPSLQRRLYEADGQPVRLGGYDVIRCVGSGGMGVVYEARSVRHGARVALKTLRAMTAHGLGRFKNEFRALCRVSHPNLVALYELGSDQGEWFFTMELVEGQSFLEHVEADGHRAPGGWEYLGETLDEGGVPTRAEDARIEDSGVVARRTYDDGKLRASLRQLASAVTRLHQLGKLHRDLNPGNVLVTREGRVVVLDFGLVSDQTRRAGVAYDGASGTPAYMSPEQAAGKPATTASDWYGFGVMLFEALTGQLPFTGSTLRMLTNKRLHASPAPSDLVAGLPPDLDALASALLRRSPDSRPTGDEVLLALGVPPRRARVPVPGDDASFVGRSAEIAALEHALAAASEGLAVTAVVEGSPGIGKSSLLARFLDRLGPSPLVVRGACHERETIPHRLLDAAVDSLAIHLAALSAAQLQALLPEGGDALARVFPVLEGLPSVGDSPDGDTQVTMEDTPKPPVPMGDTPKPRARDADPDEAAFACLRELLARLARTRPVVIAVDDAHLGDAAGARRLAELARAPNTLLVVTHAGEERDACPVLAELSAAAPLRRVAMGPLASDEALTLARWSLTGDLPSAAAGAAAAIAAASEGSPLAVVELALRHADTGGEISLAEAIGARLAGLPEPALRMAEIVAVVAGPIARGRLIAVAGAGPAGDAALAALASARVVRVDGVRDGDRVRPYDERTRALIVARTPPAMARQIHCDLARPLSPPE
jgi:serine/threonine protein kinase